MGFFDVFKNMFKARPKSRTAGLPRIDVRKRFDLLNRTGQGSMSKVWRARDMSLGRVVCLKLLDKEKTAKFEARFQGLDKPLEGTICMELKHKNIVQTYEFGVTSDNEYYLVMELVEGMGLNFLCETKSEKLDGNRVNYLSQIADSLEYLHKAGYMHRDICPRNIMLSNEGVIKLIDFGLAIPNKPDFCKPGNRTGTPNYLAPELIRRVTTDNRVDLFALGVTAYEMFTYTLPWEKAQSMQTLLSHMNSPGRDPREYRSDLDKATVAFLTKAIERDPRDRYQTAAEFRDALHALPEEMVSQTGPEADLDCQACGACCVDYFGTAGYIELTPNERPRMRALELPVVDWHGQKLLATCPHAGPGGETCCVAFEGRVGGRCECTIHPLRPAACRAFEAGSLGCLFGGRRRG